MTRPAVAVLLVAVLAVAAPAIAEEPELLEPCENPGGAAVLTLDGLTVDAENPGLPPLYEASSVTDFVLDLAGSEILADRARVDVVLTWDIPLEDYDLDLLDDEGYQLDHSENIQPLDDIEERVSGTFRHCEQFSAEILNWAAAGLSELTLELTATSL